MSSTDSKLGRQVKERLQDANLETPINWEQIAPSSTDYAKKSQFEAIRDEQEMIMRELRLDLKDDSLRDTPERVAKMYCHEIFTGLNYDNFPACTTVVNKMNHDELVIVHGSEVLSMCEHHFVPFVGDCC